ncbi:hypothetical protein HPB49_014260 [Dermacentor silvarum]|uniref:Uncharacterized protein n=1 Tax=Dermacentor silvarum TaxID=543639 RepID=A0ACB8CFM3_DERSI|nr:hypothetical protein HPB49_014260 [Dermacentor silvarum]
MRFFTRLAAQLSGGGGRVTPHLPSSRVVFVILLLASSCAVFTRAADDDDSVSSSSSHHDELDLSSCPPDDQCDTKKWCSAIAAVHGAAADDKKAAPEADEYDHGVKCLDEQVVDRCGCCRECVRGSPGLPCGGIRRRGVCAAPLECLADVAVGRIAEPHEEGTCHEARVRLSSTATQRAENEKNAAPLFGGAACGPLLEETFLGAPNDLRASGSQNPSVCRVPECAERARLRR